MEDVDGDCAAELLFALRDSAQRQLEVYAVVPGEGYALRRLLTLDEAADGPYGAPVATDLNGDGAVDLVVPMCAESAGSDGSCAAYKGFRVFYNNRSAALDCDFSGKYAATHADHFAFGFSAAASHAVELTWAGCGLEGTNGTGPTMPASAAAPLLLRPGDYNRDGYTDLLVPSSRGPLLLTGVVGGAAGGLRRMAFTCTPLDLERAQTSGRGSAYSSAVPFFVSLASMSRLDVVLTSFAATGADGSAWNEVYTNTNVPDRHYALVASALSGTAAHATLHQPGAVHRFHWQDTQMKTRRAHAVQLARTAAHALQPPRLHFGLGTTFSYVQAFTVGLRVDEALQGRTWPSYLVPQAQVFAVLRPAQQPARWTLQLYLQTSHYKALLLIVLVSTLVILGVPIVLLALQGGAGGLQEPVEPVVAPIERDGAVYRCSYCCCCRRRDWVEH
ncbi:integrin alpha FG-GAP repeat containing 1 [Strigomonas culicis]|uniref:Integrin alpha FG-GAP repeat containing 1 n=1 Tax=Strigomonas culicis TaxID=28005 RepID=S9UY70_9TRYP|nr:integrin alpha FG-GAP repeat containing 1 [Strigomonas culicis]|eukprot:EPY33788.1 integrin alpha FG-GAP repeat containing 1 [Strigomonas culicis]